MSLPLSEQSVLWYVSYISTTRDVTAKTIEGYIHGLKMLHLAVGIHIPSLNSPLVNLALNWQKSFAKKSDIFIVFKNQSLRNCNCHKIALL